MRSSSEGGQGGPRAGGRGKSSAGGRGEGDPAKPKRAEKQKPSHRQRLLEAMTESVARKGYADTTVADVIEHAGVSRATFYEHFSDKEDCFLAVQKELSQAVLDRIDRTVKERENGPVQVLLLPGLLELAEQQRSGLQLLANEALVAGPKAMQARDELIANVEERVEDLWAHSTDPSSVPDIPIKALVGGTIRLLANRVRQGDNHLPDLLPGLAGWYASYLREGDGPRWSMVRPRAENGEEGRPAQHGASREKLIPRPLPRGRHKLPAGYVKRNRRERIMQAAGELALSKGYAATNVADIVSVAGVSRDVFYENFHDKQEAFVASYELGFRETLSTSAGAFFGGGGEWPERVWEAARAFTEFFDTEPGLSQIGFVEAYALGPAVVRRITDTQIAFTMFLEEGYGYRPEAEKLPRLCSEAIAVSIFELAYHHQRCNPQMRMSDMLGEMAYVTLAPFMGPEAASEMIVAKLEARPD